MDFGTTDRAVDLLAPDLGAPESARVSAWLVEPGESVREGDRLVELLMPGVTYDVPAPVTGQLIEVAAGVGTAVRAGDLLGRIRLEDLENTP